MAILCQWSEKPKNWKLLRQYLVIVRVPLRAPKYENIGRRKNLNLYLFSTWDPKIRFPDRYIVRMCHHLWNLVAYTKTAFRYHWWKYRRTMTNILNCTLKQRRDNKFLHTGHCITNTNSSKSTETPSVWRMWTNLTVRKPIESVNTSIIYLS